MGSTDPFTDSEWLTLDAQASASQRLAALYAAIEAGLAAGERVLFVTGSEELAALEESLAALAPFEDAIAHGALLIAPPSLVRPTDPAGPTSAGRLFDEALAAGYRGVRVIVDANDAPAPLP